RDRNVTGVQTCALPIFPDQVATVGRNRWGDTWPIGVEYDAPTDLPSNLAIIGDIHCHVDGGAYASYTDKDDEVHRPGLHVVVGQIGRASCREGDGNGGG